ncbi:MAG TPA: universal stress protein [Thermodesulfobacteriota bacterium]|nr:universal stress protein [Thermodesulfobacteriota bacterium]
MLIDKILWASDGSKDSTEALKYAQLWSKQFKAEIVGLFVIPDYTKSVLSQFSSEDRDKFSKWIEETKLKERKALENIAKTFKEKGTGFKVEITNGIPYEEILRVANEERVDLIVMGKGRPVEKYILGGTALKVLRGSSIPVLTAREAKKNLEIKRILVPTDLAHGLTKDFKFAVGLCEEFDAVLYLLNVVEVGERGFPLEIAEQMKLFSLKELEENIGKTKVRENIVPCVETSKNAWKGIVKFVEDRDIDLIVMMTYGGGKFKDNFIGSVAEKVIQESPCPVITMKP